MEKVLRFYLSNTDTYKHGSVYEFIARSAKKSGLSGATVYRCSMGFGKTSQLRSDKFWEFNIKQPVIVEIIDEENRLRDFVKELAPILDAIPKGFLVTLQDVEILFRKQGEKRN
jgi:PII-like signaling protein|nr:DUF190 domain-containing protein [uncultured Prevotella sp.]